MRRHTLLVRTALRLCPGTGALRGRDESGRQEWIDDHRYLGVNERSNGLESREVGRDHVGKEEENWRRPLVGGSNRFRAGRDGSRRQLEQGHEGLVGEVVRSEEEVQLAMVDAERSSEERCNRRVGAVCR